MFVFTPLTREDLPFLIEVRNEFRDSLHDNRVFALTECELWFRNQKPDFHVIWNDRERIGYFRLSNHDRAKSSIYIGADLHRNFHGLGLARQAYNAFMPLVIDRYFVSVFRLEVLSHNSAAHRLYRHLGFVEIDRKKAFAVRDNQLVDSIVMELRVGKYSGEITS